MDEQNKKEYVKKDETGQPVKEIHHYHYRRGSFFGRLAWGLIIIFIGVLLLAQNAGALPGFQIWNFLAVFWPVFIVIAGLSLLARGGWIMGIVSAIIILAILGLFAAWFFGAPIFGVLNNADDTQVRTHSILVERNPLANSANLIVRFGAGELNIRGGSGNLAEGALNSGFAEPKVTSSLEGTVQRASIEPQGAWRGFRGYENRLDLNLSNTLPLSLEIDSGASDLNLDFSEQVLNSLTLRAGASNLDITLGSKAERSEISIFSGASSININYPSLAGIRVVMRGGLSSRNFTGLSETSPGVWESGNYAASQKKINISLDAGVSSVNINGR